MKHKKTLTGCCSCLLWFTHVRNSSTLWETHCQEQDKKININVMILIYMPGLFVAEQQSVAVTVSSFLKSCNHSEVNRFGTIVPVRRPSLTLSFDLGLADGNGEVFGLRLLRHLEGNTVHQLVLQEYHCNTQTHTQTHTHWGRIQKISENSDTEPIYTHVSLHA